MVSSLSESTSLITRADKPVDFCAKPGPLWIAVKTAKKAAPGRTLSLRICHPASRRTDLAITLHSHYAGSARPRHPAADETCHPADRLSRSPAVNYRPVSCGRECNAEFGPVVLLAKQTLKNTAWITRRLRFPDAIVGFIHADCCHHPRAFLAADSGRLQFVRSPGLFVRKWPAATTPAELQSIGTWMMGQGTTTRFKVRTVFQQKEDDDSDTGKKTRTEKTSSEGFG